MSDTLATFVNKVCGEAGNDPTRLMDMAQAVQMKFGCVSGKAMDLIAKKTGLHRVEVESLVSFYSFLSEQPKGRIVIRLCDDVIDLMSGAKDVAAALSAELGIGFGETTADGAITLEYTPCIGMCDQAPAALVNDVVVTHLTPTKARALARSLKAGEAPRALVKKTGDGNNAHTLVQAMVANNIRRKGPVIFDAFQSGSALVKALAMSPAEVIRDVKTSRLRGRGGAGFPTGMKWDFTRQAAGSKRYVLCNADEGEPGTFKDRVMLTECPDLLFEGMTIAGYAVGAEEAVLYLRGEYAYLQAFLEDVLNKRRKHGWLGKNAGGKEGFHFDIRIQLGSGAYVCGEETALISSCEGLRGDPKTRPPFPAQKGYLGCPTTVNNVETFCCVSRILDKGPGWFAQMGSKGSPGTKLISISGDCRHPGVYEIPFGTCLSELLDMAGAENTMAVQIGGPSGRMVAPADFGRAICYDDLATGGAVMVFNKSRSILDIVDKFMEFFVEESCGYCTPCRVGNVLIRERLQKIMEGHGARADIPYLKDLCERIKFTSRCGLGQTSPNPVLSTLAGFPGAYGDRVHDEKTGLRRAFDLKAAVAESEALTERQSTHAGV